MPRSLYIVLITLFMASIACSYTSNETPSEEIQFVDTTNWVAFVAFDGQIAAPPETWRSIPIDLSSALIEKEQLDQTFPTVANVYYYIVQEYSFQPITRLMLMREDGRAWMVYEQIDLLGNDFDEQVEQYKMRWRAQGNVPFDEEDFSLSAGSGKKWDVTYSPQGSQLVQRRTYYAFNLGERMVVLTFETNNDDFYDFRNIFHTMADTFQVIE